MADEIKTKTFKYGHEHESEWPPKFGKGKRGIFHISKETGKLQEGYGPRKERYAMDQFTTDDIKPFQSMVDGQVFTSKSKYRKHLKTHGYKEVGNESTARKTSVYEKQQEVKANSEKRREQIRMARELVKNNMSGLTEYDKHRCEIINRNLRNYNYDRRERHPDDE